MLLHRKNDSRDASSRSLMRYAVFGATPAGSRSTRNRNSRLTRMALRAASMPASKSAFAPGLAIERQQALRGRRRRRAADRPGASASRGSASRRPLPRPATSAARRRCGGGSGVSPGPFASNGPVIDTWYTAGESRGWRCKLKCALYGWRVVSSSDDGFFRNVTPRSCGPAFAATRTFRWASTCLEVLAARPAASP